MTLDEMGCPTEVWIMGHRWYVRDDDSFARGWMVGDDRSLRLKTRYESESGIRETLLHEIVHAIDHDVRDKCRNRDKTLFRKLRGNKPIFTEQDVLLLSCCLFQVFTDPRNAGLADWIFKGVDPRGLFAGIEVRDE